MAEIRLDQLTKRFGRTAVIHGLDLTIPSGQLTVLLGPSGCGKSTLLRMIAGLEDVSGGTIAIDGETVNDIDPARRRCAMVFQSYALYPHKTVYKNLAFPLRMAGQSREDIDRRVREVATLLELEALLDRLPRDLSGGQRQRVAMGRAMIREPRVFLFDEPLSNLDAELRVKMRLEIARLQRELEATMVFVTHDQVEAMTLAHCIVVMRAGLIEQVGAPLEIYDDPKTRFVAGFVGSPAMNFFEVTDTRSDAQSAALTLKDGTTVELPHPLAGVPKTLGVRPEHVRLREAPINLSLEGVRDLGIEHLGDRSYHYLSTGFGDLTVLQPEGYAQIDGAHTFRFGLEPANLRLFDAAGRRVPLDLAALSAWFSERLSSRFGIKVL
ncbi:MAG: sn-glycerol-3-phosphate ABC transporter ATP-binding protein UgpC [Pseudomonadota bacterium]